MQTAPPCHAVIDVGTNSVKLLVAQVTGRVVRPVLEKSVQTRLGQGFYQGMRLQPEVVLRTAEVVAVFAAQAAELHPASTRVIATSAVREAVNQEDLRAAIETACGLKVEIISGEQEAEWVFRGVTTDSPVAGHPLLVLEVGGGSTEFILGERGFIYFRRSFPLGTVRLLEILRPSDPPSADDLVRCRRWLKEFFCRAVRPKLQPPLGSFCGRTLKLVGTGGAAATLARLHVGMIGQAAEPLSAHPLTAQQVSAQVERLWALPLAQRVKLVGLSAQKADVILPGAAIFEALMEDFAFDELAVSANGMRYGALIASAEALGHRASLGCDGSQRPLFGASLWPPQHDKAPNPPPHT